MSIKNDYSCFDVQLTTNGVLEVAMNRPKQLNAMNAAFFAETREIFEMASNNDDVLCVLLYANGRVFTAGLDLVAAGEMLSGSDDESKVGELYKHIKDLQKDFQAVEECTKPTIALIHNKCIGGGMDLVLACDIRMSTKDATFSVKETAIAIVADLGTLHRILKCCGKSMAYYMALSAQPINAHQAMQSGLISHVHVDRDSLLTEGRQAASKIAQYSPLAVQGTKRVMQFSENHNSSDALEYVAVWNSAFLRSPDLTEAITAFAQKRKPQFKCKL